MNEKLPSDSSEYLQEHPDAVTDVDKAHEMTNGSKPLVEERIGKEKTLDWEQKAADYHRESGQTPDNNRLEGLQHDINDLNRQAEVVDSATGILYDSEKLAEQHEVEARKTGGGILSLFTKRR